MRLLSRARTGKLDVQLWGPLFALGLLVLEIASARPNNRVAEERAAQPSVGRAHPYFPEGWRSAPRITSLDRRIASTSTRAEADAEGVAAPLSPIDLAAEGVLLPPIEGQLFPGTQVHLSWSDPNPPGGATGFNVYKFAAVDPYEGSFLLYDRTPPGSGYLDPNPFGSLLDPDPTFQYPFGDFYELRYRVAAVSDAGESPLSTEVFATSYDVAGLSDEPNDSIPLATPLRTPTAIHTRDLVLGDVDYYRIDVPARSVLRARVEPVSATGELRLGLFDSTGQLLNSTIAGTSGFPEVIVSTSFVARSLWLAVASLGDGQFDGGEDATSQGRYTLLVDVDPMRFPRPVPVADARDDTFGVDRLPAVGAPDLVSVGASLTDTDLLIRLEFASTVVPSFKGGPNALFGFVEIGDAVDFSPDFTASAAEICPNPVLLGDDFAVELATDETLSARIFGSPPTIVAVGDQIPVGTLRFTGALQEIVEVRLPFTIVSLGELRRGPGLVAVVGNSLTSTDCAPDAWYGYLSSRTDTDLDGLPDAEEIDVHGTDPTHFDTDRGGEIDGSEIREGRDPLLPADDVPGRDSDNDGVLDIDEADFLETDPFNPDTDGDGALDGAECAPLDPSVSAGFVEVGSSLRFDPDRITLRWDAVEGALAYNLYRGAVPPGSTFNYNHTCFSRFLALPTGQDPALPGAGEVFYYLASATNECGEGGLGSGTLGPRPVAFPTCSQPAAPSEVEATEFILPPLPDQVLSPGSQVHISWRDDNPAGSVSSYDVFKSLYNGTSFFGVEVVGATRLIDDNPFLDLYQPGGGVVPDISSIRYQVSAVSFTTSSPPSAPAAVAPALSSESFFESDEDARSAACGQRQTAVLDPLGDVDSFHIQVPGGATLQVEIFAQRIGSALDSVLGVFSGGNLLALNDDAFGLDSRVEISVPGTSPVFLTVRVSSFPDFDFDGGGAQTSGIYTLAVDCPGGGAP